MLQKAASFIAGLACLAFSTALADDNGHMHTGAPPERLGTVHFPISCTAEASLQFQRGVALLHSFSYEEANTAFAGVARSDPSCAMAYWGQAMTHYHQMWEPPDARAMAQGLAAAESGRKLGAKSQRENDYIAAIDLFYKEYDRVDFHVRSLAYTQAMERMYADYPADKEVAVFYALALVATAAPTDKTYANQKKAGAILEKIFIDQPDHPGVAHYIVHAYDSPLLAQRALPAARKYAQIAPSASHALHMPSHIFTRLGLWDESIESNIASSSAGAFDAAHFNGARNTQQLHALDYLVYAYLQTGQYKRAKAIVDDVATITSVYPQDLPGAYALTAIPARYAVERGQWPEAANLRLNLANIPPARYPWCGATVTFAQAIGLVRLGDPRGPKLAEELAAEVKDLQAKGQPYWASEVQIELDEVSGWIHHQAKDEKSAEISLRSAVALEDSTEKHAVTPGPIEPAHEMLADLLAAEGRPAEALPEYAASLARSPGRLHALTGAARAAKETGAPALARAYYSRLLALAQHADSGIPEITEAKAYVAAGY